MSSQRICNCFPPLRNCGRPDGRCCQGTLLVSDSDQAGYWRSSGTCCLMSEFVAGQRRVLNERSCENCQGVATSRNFEVSLVVAHGQTCVGDNCGKTRRRDRKVHILTMIFAGSSDADCSDKTEGGRRRLGFLFAPLPLSLRVTCYVAHCPSRFFRRSVKSSLGGVVYAFSGLADQMGLPREFYDFFWM